MCFCTITQNQICEMLLILVDHATFVLKQSLNIIFYSISAFLVSNESFLRILHYAENFFEKSSFLTKLWPFKLSDDVMISDFPVAARKLRIFK